MRRLMLFRHAKSDRNQPGKRDHERILNARGVKEAPLMGAFMAHHGFVPELAVVSTAARTRETWDLAAKSLPEAASRFEDSLYDASTEAVVEVIMGTEAEVKTLMLVGHNPSMHDVAVALVGTGEIEARQRLQEKFPTAAVAIIDFAITDWRKLRAAAGRLERFVSPRTLEAAID